MSDFSMAVAGEYSGDAYPSQQDYRITITVLGTGEDFGMVVENASGGVVGSAILSSDEADGLISMASIDHSLSGYEDDWAIPVGMGRVLTWTLDTDDDVWISLREDQIDEIAHWLAHALAPEGAP